ncbi:hypothetical protein GEV33_006148 [Tenebrio molitor]|jgi:hypothetical protein|uniref:Uncharacterized protein n=1 Tax=Tenebrio molitor TaxID=7067 RepID=A0A8J6HLU5_TENMO|nr:hypothetical protein GEV33_006148 [Tenebrio molitor]
MVNDRLITVKCRKREEAATISQSQSKNPRLDILQNNFPKGQSKSSGETSNLLIVDLPSFFLQLGNFLLSSPGLVFLISSFSHIIFDLPQNNAFVCRTLQRQVRVPTGATAGSLRRATHNAPRRRIHPAKSHPHRSPGVQIPAATSTAATTVRAFHS